MKLYDYCKQNKDSYLKALLFCIKNLYLEFDEKNLSSIIYNFNDERANYSLMKTFNEWKDLGFKIKTGSHGIKYKKFNSLIDDTFYFDITQTEYNPELVQKLKINLINSKYFERLNEFIDNYFTNRAKNGVVYSQLHQNIVKYVLFENYGLLEKIENLDDFNLLDFHKNLNDIFEQKTANMFKNEDLFYNSFINLLIDLYGINLTFVQEMDKENITDLYVELPLDKSNTKYYIITNGKNEKEVKNAIFNSGNQESNSEKSNEIRFRGSYKINEKEGKHTLFSYGRDQGIRRELVGMVGGANKHESLHSTREFNISSERIDDQTNTGSRLLSSDDFEFKTRISLESSDMGNESQLSREIESDIGLRKENVIGSTERRDDTTIFRNDERKNSESNKENIEISRQTSDLVNGGSNGTFNESLEKSSSIFDGEKISSGYLFTSVDESNKEILSGKRKNDIVSSLQKGNTFSNSRSDLQFSSLINKYKEFNKLSETQLLLDFKEKQFLNIVIDYYINQSQNKTYYNSFIEIVYEQINDDVNLAGREFLPYKLDLLGINGNSISLNRDNLTNIISFYLENNTNINDSDKCLAYSINRKLFLKDYGIVDKVNDNGRVKTYDDVNIYYLSYDEVMLLKNAINDNAFMKNYNYSDDDELITIIKNIKLNDDFDNNYILNLQDNICFSNRLNYEFQTFFGNYKDYVIDRDGVDKIDILEIFDKNYLKYKSFTTLGNKLLYESKLQDLTFNEELKAIKYNDIINLSKDDINDIVDSDILNNYVKIIFNYNAENDSILNNKYVLNTLINIKNNINFNNNELKDKILDLEKILNNNKVLDNGVSNINESDVEIISNEEFNKSLLSDLDVKFENFDFSLYYSLNDKVTFDKNLFYQFLTARKDLLSENSKINKDKNSNGFSEYVLAHFFGTAGDWYVFDYQKENDLMFGFVELSGYPDGAEFGWFSLDEIVNLRNKPFNANINDNVISLPMFLDLELKGIYGNEKLCEYYKNKYQDYFQIDILKKDLDYIDAKSKWRNSIAISSSKIINNVEYLNNNNVDNKENDAKNSIIDNNLSDNEIKNNNVIFDVFKYKNRTKTKEALIDNLIYFTQFVFNNCLKNSNNNLNNDELKFDDLFENNDYLLNYIDNLYELGLDKNSNVDLYFVYKETENEVISYINNHNDKKLLSDTYIDDYIAELIFNSGLKFNSKELFKNQILKYLDNDGFILRKNNKLDEAIIDIFNAVEDFLYHYHKNINDIYTNNSLAVAIYNYTLNLDNYLVNNGYGSLIDFYIKDYFDNDFLVKNIEDKISQKSKNLISYLAFIEDSINEINDNDTNKSNLISDFMLIQDLINLYCNFELKIDKNIELDNSVNKFNDNVIVNNNVNIEDNVTNNNLIADNEEKNKIKNNNINNEYSIFINSEGQIQFTLKNNLSDEIIDVENINEDKNNNNISNDENINTLINKDIKEELDKREVEEIKNDVNDNVINGNKIDFKITNLKIDSVSKSQRFNDNCAAIEMLFKLENENRYGNNEELNILSKFSGWGGLYSYFELGKCDIKDFDRIKNLLTDEDYEKAKLSSLDSFYTPYQVIDLIYNKISQMGFNGGRILEPSCGVGRFFGLMPNNIFENSEITGVELDSISSRICSKLYPSVKIINKGFEDYKINKNYDLIIGNVPFGDSTPYDPIYNKQNFKIHDYFINKCLANLNNGGICAIITSSGTLDKYNNKAREVFSVNANFLGGIRLPNGVFNLDGKGTTTNADLLFFQKDNEHALKYEQEFVNSNKMFSIDNIVKKNETIFYNKITDKYEKIIRKRLDDYDKEFLLDLFLKQNIILNDPDDVEIINKQLLGGYGFQFLINDTKMNELYDKYKIWVSNGKKEEEKLIVNNLKDFYIFETGYRFEENEEFTKVYTPLLSYEFSNKKNNNKYLINDNRNLIGNTREFYEKLSDVYLNDYYGNNIKQILGDLSFSTDQFGKVVVNNNINDNFINDLKLSLDNIKGTYFKEIEEVKEDDKTKEYINNDIYEQNNLNLITPYSYFVFNDRICFKELEEAYYLKTSSGNDLNKNVINQYKLLINLRTALVNILKFENEGNYKIADEHRKLANNYYDLWVKTYKHDKDSSLTSNIIYKKDDPIYLNDKYVESLFKDDRYFNFLKSSELFEDISQNSFKKGKLRIKGKLRLNVDEKNNIYEEDLDNIVSDFDYELNDGEIVHLYQLIDDKIYDVDGFEYKNSLKHLYTNFNKNSIYYEPVISNTNNLLTTDDPKLALKYSLQRKGNIDLNYINSVLNYKYNNEQLLNILQNDIIFDYLQDKYILMEDFLSHNVKKKIIDYSNLMSETENQLKIITYDIEHGNIENDDFSNKKIVELKNKINIIDNYIEKLDKVKPVNIPYSAISINLGSKWFPVSIYNEFLFKMFKLNESSISSRLFYYDNADEFVISHQNSLNFKIPETINLLYGFSYNNGKNSDKRVSPIELFLAAINLKEYKCQKFVGMKKNAEGKDYEVWITEENATQMANSIIKKIKNNFVDFLNNLDENNRNLIEQIYNDKYNQFVKRSFVCIGKDLTFNGISNKIKLHPYQLDVVNRAILQGNTMFAHTVGAGKTYEMIATGMKFKELGLSNKNMYVVSKNLLVQWEKDFMELFPNANILVPNDKDFDVKNRLTFLNRIATGNYDAIILTYEQFCKIPLSPDRESSYLKQDIQNALKTKEEIDTISRLNNISKDDITYRVQIKSINKFIRDKENLLKRMLKKESKDKNVVYFDNLGIDKLFVDEAHNFKNAYFTTKLSNIKGITSQLRQRVYDMQLKCRYLNEISNYTGVYMGTGTPISNSIVELYTMMNYLRPDKLKELNIDSLDKFIATFSGINTDFELDATATQFTLQSRIKSFQNVPELMNLVNESFDIINRDDLLKFSNNSIILPKVHRFNCILPETKISKLATLSLVKRAEKIKKKMVKVEDDNMLLLTTNGKQLALDVRLLDKNAPVDSINKINAVVHYASEIYNKFNERKATQLIFCDYGLPNNKGNFDVYSEIKSKLIESGIKSSEIAFINDWDSPELKKILSEKVNNGDIRIVIGGTQKLGTGMNLQERLIAEHHLSIPYRPSDIEQREGRIIRQGNGNPNIYIFNYTKQGSFDARSYSILENKQNGINQIFSKNNNVRNVDDIDDSGNDSINFVELIACASNDNSIKEIMQLQQEVNTLENSKVAMQEQLKKNKIDIEVNLPNLIKKENEYLDFMEKDYNYYLNKKDTDYKLIIYGKKIGEILGEYNGDKDFVDKNGIEIFRNRMQEIKEKQLGQEVLLAEYRGFKIKALWNIGADFNIYFYSPSSNRKYMVDYKFNDVRIDRLEKFLSENIKFYIENHKKNIKEYEEEITNKKNAENFSFKNDEELIEKKIKLKKLMEENANNSNSILKFDENGKVNEDSIDLEKASKLLSEQAEKLEIAEKDFEYEKFDYVEDNFDESRLIKRNSAKNIKNIKDELSKKCNKIIQFDKNCSKDNNKINGL